MNASFVFEITLPLIKKRLKVGMRFKYGLRVSFSFRFFVCVLFACVEFPCSLLPRLSFRGFFYRYSERLL